MIYKFSLQSILNEFIAGGLMPDDCYNGVVLYFEPVDLELHTIEILPIVGLKRKDLREIEIGSAYRFDEILKLYEQLSERGVAAISGSCPESFVDSIRTRTEKIISKKYKELETLSDAYGKSYQLLDILEGNVIETMKKLLNPSVIDHVKFVEND